VPIPKPKSDEKEKDFISRCMGNDTMKEDYPDNDQRLAICYDSWRKKKGGKKPDTKSEVLEMERRFIPIEKGSECRVLLGEDEKPKGITGIAAVYGVRTDIGPFEEEIVEGAFSGIVKQDIRGLANHDVNRLLGRTKSGTMKVWDDSRGFHYDIPELPKTRADVLESVGRGDLDGNSFGFMVPKDGSGEEWLEENRDKPLRRILRFERIFDAGPVVFPQYDEGTVVNVRSAETVYAEYRSRMETREPEKLEVPVQEDGSDADQGAQERLKEAYAQRNSMLRDKQLRDVK